MPAKRYTIQEGDGVSKIAYLEGFFAPTIWEHPENAELRSRRAHADILAPGDVVYVPDKQPKTVRCATGKRHVFRRRGVPARFSIQLLENGRPIASREYTLTVGETVLTGVTDENGYVRQFVPPDARRGELSLEEGRKPIQLEFGGLEPVTGIRGVQQRLNNLGFGCGPANGVAGEQLEAALRRFQARLGLPATGAMDSETTGALAEIHDRGGVLPPEPPSGDS